MAWWNAMSGATRAANIRALLGVASVQRLVRTTQLGVKSLWLRKLRSLLTVLGIVFGVCSVIAMLAIGEGLSYEAQEQIRRLGSNNIILRSVKPAEERRTTTERTYVVEYGLTYEDINRIKLTIPSVEILVPSRNIRKDVWNGPQRVDCDIVGTVPWYQEMRNHHVEHGRFFTDAELEASVNVCVLGHGLPEALFPIDDPVGRTVRIDGDYYRVIGVMEPKSRQPTAAAGGLGDQSNPDAAKANSGTGAPFEMYIPLGAAKNRFGETLVQRSSGSFSAERAELHEATVKVKSTTTWSRRTSFRN